MSSGMLYNTVHGSDSADCVGVRCGHPTKFVPLSDVTVSRVATTWSEPNEPVYKSICVKAVQGLDVNRPFCWNMRRYTRISWSGSGALSHKMARRDRRPRSWKQGHKVWQRSVGKVSHSLTKRGCIKSLTHDAVTAVSVWSSSAHVFIQYFVRKWDNNHSVPTWVWSWYSCINCARHFVSMWQNNRDLHGSREGSMDKSSTYNNQTIVQTRWQFSERTGLLDMDLLTSMRSDHHGKLHSAHDAK